jgi:hypothetical protein
LKGESGRQVWMAIRARVGVNEWEWKASKSMGVGGAWAPVANDQGRLGS